MCSLLLCTNTIICRLLYYTTKINFWMQRKLHTLIRFGTVSIMKECKFCIYRYINIRPDILIFLWSISYSMYGKKQKSLNILSTFLGNPLISATQTSSLFLRITVIASFQKSLLHLQMIYRVQNNYYLLRLPT